MTEKKRIIKYEVGETATLIIINVEHCKLTLKMKSKMNIETFIQTNVLSCHDDDEK